MASCEPLNQVLQRTAEVTARRRRLTRCAQVVALAVATALAAGAADALFALGDGVRQTWRPLLPLVPAVAVAWVAWRWTRQRPDAATAARLAEAALADRDRRLTAACELAAMPGPLAAAGAAAIAGAVDAGQVVRGLPPGRWRGPLFAAVAGLACMAVVAALVPGLARTVWQRWSDPTGDHPAWSRTTLTWVEVPARVRAGAAARVVVAVAGPGSGTPLLRGAGVSVPLFPLGGGQWAGELAAVATDATVWVEAGGTRTTRQRIAVDPVPVLSALTLTLNAPAWSRLSPETQAWRLETVATFSALPGSELVLMPQANRPLVAVILGSGAEARRIPLEGGAVRIPGEPGLVHLAGEAADGIRGEPLLVARISVRADAPPRAAITKPSHDTLATSNARLPLAISAEDDLGLVEAVTVSGMNGLEAPALRRALTSGRRWDEERVLDLAALGLRPGDVMSLGLLVRDSSPTIHEEKPGQPSAWAGRNVRVISDEEYNRSVRRRLSVDALERKYGNVVRNLRELEVEAEALRGQPRDAELDRRLAALAQRAAALSAAVKALRRDKPLFAIEHDIQDELAAAADELAAAAKAGDPDRLPTRKRGARMGKDLAQLTELAKANGLAARLKQLADAEQNTVARLAPLADHRRANDVDRVRLRELAEQEDGLAGAVEAWPDLAREVAERLRREQPQPAEQLDALAKALGDGEVADLKRRAATAARAGDGATAHRLAAAARDRLLALLPAASRCQGGACAGAGLSFSWCRPGSADDAMGLGLGFGVGGWGAGGAGDGGLGMMLGYGGDDQGGSYLMEGLDLVGPEALGDLGGRIGDRDGPGVAAIAAAGDGRVGTAAAGYARGVRTTTATERVRLDRKEADLVGDYLRRLTSEEPSHGK